MQDHYRFTLAKNAAKSALTGGFMVFYHAYAHQEMSQRCTMPGNITTLPPQEVLNALFYYDAGTGYLYKRTERSRETTIVKNKRGVVSGRLVGHKNDAGYIIVSVSYTKPDGTKYQKSHGAHRIIWKMVRGTDPFVVDHINHIRDDNRWENLRSVTHKENMQNRSPRKENVNKNIRPCHMSGKWVAYTYHNRRYKHIGTYETVEDARAARDKYHAAKAHVT